MQGHQNDAPTLVLRHLQEDNVAAGVAYVFRVRARNAMGWGLFSDEFVIVAAETPE